MAQTNVLTEAMRGGDFSAVAGLTLRDPLTGLAFANNVIPASRLDPLAVSMINSYQPLPNQTGANNFRGLTRVEDTIDQFITLVFGYVWDIPFGSSLTGVKGVLLNGWQLSGIGIFNSGSPVYINQDGDTLNVDSEEIRPNLVAGQDPTLPGSERTIARWFNTAAFARATTTYGTSPRNPVVGPGRKVVDLSLAKSFDIQDRRQIQFRIEAFNAFNWVNWNNPNGSLGNSNFGIISGAGAAREMQLSLKYTF